MYFLSHSSRRREDLPARLIEPAPADPASAVRRRQLVLNSGLCASRSEASSHGDMASLIGINGKPFDMGRIDIETKLGTAEVWRSRQSAWRTPPMSTEHYSKSCRLREGRRIAGWKDGTRG